MFLHHVNLLFLNRVMDGVLNRLGKERVDIVSSSLPLLAFRTLLEGVITRPANEASGVFWVIWSLSSLVVVVLFLQREVLRSLQP